MAKKLKSIKFPGLPGAYTVPDVDKTLSVEGDTADAKAVGDALEKKLTATESAEYPGCYYRMVDGEVEWLNPPMVPSVEYRTAERHNGKVVYTKLINHGNLPASGHNYSNSGVAADKIIELKAYAYYPDGFKYIFPIHSIQTGIITGVCWAENMLIGFYCPHDEARATAEATIKYTKD